MYDIEVIICVVVREGVCYFGDVSVCMYDSGEVGLVWVVI